MDKLFKRGLRQGKFNGFNFLKSYRKSQLPQLDRIAIRQSVQNMYECDDDSADWNWGVGSKFQLEAFEIKNRNVNEKDVTDTDVDKLNVNTTTLQPTDTNLETIMQFLTEVSSRSVETNLKVYTPSENDSSQVAHIVLELASIHSRRSLLQTILTAFKPIFPKRFIPVDGATGKSFDWIVIDLKSTCIHIFDPKVRHEVNLDNKLQLESSAKGVEHYDADHSSKLFIKNYESSIPKSMASRTNLIDKFYHRKMRNNS